MAASIQIVNDNYKKKRDKQTNRQYLPTGAIAISDLSRAVYNTVIHTGTVHLIDTVTVGIKNLGRGRSHGYQQHNSDGGPYLQDPLLHVLYISLLLV